MSYWVIIAGVLTAALTGAGGAEIIKAVLARSSRKQPRQVVHAASEVSLAKQAQEYAQSVEADAKEARSAAQEAWRVVHDAEQRQVRLNRKLDEVQYSVSMLSHYVNWLVNLILLPDTTMDELRQAVIVRKPPSVHTPPQD